MSKDGKISFSHVGMFVTDIDKMADFYSARFGAHGLRPRKAPGRI